MTNGASLESKFEVLDSKVDTIRESLARMEVHLDADHIKVAEHDKSIGDLNDTVHGIREDYSFMKGQVSMIKVLGGALVGLAVILQAISMFMG